MLKTALDQDIQDRQIRFEGMRNTRLGKGKKSEQSNQKKAFSLMKKKKLLNDQQKRAIDYKKKLVDPDFYGDIKEQLQNGQKKLGSVRLGSMLDEDYL